MCGGEVSLSAGGQRADCQGVCEPDMVGEVCVCSSTVLYCIVPDVVREVFVAVLGVVEVFPALDTV